MRRQQYVARGFEPAPDIFTPERKKKPKLGDKSFHPGMLRFSSTAGQRKRKR